MQTRGYGVPEKTRGHGRQTRYSAGQLMNKNPVIPALITVLLVSALATLALTYFNIQYSRKGRSLQFQAAGINNTRLVMDALAKDALIYSQTNRAIDPILISLGIKQGPASSATAKPATR